MFAEQCISIYAIQSTRDGVLMQFKGTKNIQSQVTKSARVIYYDNF